MPSIRHHTYPTISSIIPTASCCTSNSTPHDSVRWHKNVDLICRIALAAFAAYIEWPLFSLSVSAGILLGAGYAITRYIQHQPMFPNGESKPVCAQGYMDFLSGMRFPPTMSSLATTAFIAAHMRHDPQFFIPFCGLFIGFWLGRETVSKIKYEYNNYA